MVAVSGQRDDVDDEQLSPQGQLLDDGTDEEPDEDLLARIRQI
jgi:hypothetical protein